MAWLELPSSLGNQEYVCTTFDDSVPARNYSYNYDKDMFTSLWVAYPLYSSVTGGNCTGSWKGDPNVPNDYEITLSSSYGVNVGGTSPDGFDETLPAYERGHQIPNADRNNSEKMNSQTYYYTNSTPQHPSFNRGAWSSLEAAVRKNIPSGDTLYVVTGASFHKIGSPVKEEVKWILPKNETNTDKKCPVPNYYWKVLLKVKRDSSGTPVSASTIGFWYENREYTDIYSNYSFSVDQIEAWTGFDFFVNLKDSLENTVESISNWDDFQNF